VLSKIDLLEKLAELRRNNLLTEQEYEAQKKQILSEASPLHEPPAAAAQGQVETEPSDWTPEADAAAANLKTPLLIVGALGLLALLAFFTVPGSPGARAVAVARWEAMSTPELEHEFQRAYMTGMSSFVTCSNGEDDEAEAACAKIVPILDDTIAMGDILCNRDAASQSCSMTMNLKEMKQLIGSLSDMSEEMQQRLNDLTSYEPR
jgi:hypothetical protein